MCQRGWNWTNRVRCAKPFESTSLLSSTGDNRPGSRTKRLIGNAMATNLLFVTFNLEIHC
jgi:hypothetical protein